MPKIQITYAPDDSCGHIPVKDTPRSLLTGKPVKIKSVCPDDYQKILLPTTLNNRMEVKADIPRSLTPKGFTKLKFAMSIADKQYDLMVKKCLKDKKLWEDPDFPATSASIGNIAKLPAVEWKRPKEINKNAEFFVGGADRFDIEQGQIGDCWLLAVVSSITISAEMFKQVVPVDQKINSDNYVGIFRFRFWRFGEWTQVLVDDRLPVQRGTNNLLFMHSNNNTEFWSALLEKAYAKLNGSYANLSGGSQSEAMEDVTGGLCESIDLNGPEAPTNLQAQLINYAERCCLMGCSALSDETEGKLPNGLIGGHAYSVTGVKKVTYRGKPQLLVRCRNPWGGNYEWTGAWADKSKEWKDIPANELKDLNVQFNNDGEFWMSFEDFCTFFNKLEVCHLGLESLENEVSFLGKRRLEEKMFVGEWIKGSSAGGCSNNRETFWTNPQFRVDITDPDPLDNDFKCTVVIGLMQKDVRQKNNGQYFTIGFMVYAANPKSNDSLSRAFFLTNKAIGKSSYINTREVTAKLKLDPGTYVIVPTTFDANEECKFIVRVFSQVLVKGEAVDENNVKKDVSQDVLEAVKQSKNTEKEEAEMKKKFMAETNKKGEVHALSLKNLLNNSNMKDVVGFSGFNTEVCRSMVAAMDNNQTGGLEYDEFKELWDCCNNWKVIFQRKDADKNGVFNAFEFREALDESGYKVSNKVFNALVQRYSHEIDDTINFEDFILCMFRLKNAFETANAHPKNLEGNCCFLMEDYLRFAMYI